MAWYERTRAIAGGLALCSVVSADTIWRGLGFEFPVAFALSADLRRPDLVSAGISTVALLSYFLTWSWALAACVLVVGALRGMRGPGRPVPLS